GVGLDWERAAVVLGRGYWKYRPNRARDLRTVNAGAEDEHVGGQRFASLQRRRAHLAAARRQLRHSFTQKERRAHPFADRLHPARELDAVAARIGDPVDRSRQLVFDRGEERLGFDDAVGIQDVLLLPMLLNELHLFDARFETLRIAI